MGKPAFRLHDQAPDAAICAQYGLTIGSRNISRPCLDARPGHSWDDTFMRITSRTSAWPRWRCWKRRALKSLAGAAPMLRTARLQPGLPRRGRQFGPAQSRVVERRRWRHADYFSRTVLLFDVRRGLQELKLPDVENVARRCFLFEDFIENFLKREPNGLYFNNRAGRLPFIRTATPSRWPIRTSCVNWPSGCRKKR